jgi:triacylglycerol esterase/lipase EstA (alpha/beta hydrolase family)
MSEEESLRAVIAEERKFLHDLSNHIVVAHGMATFALRGIKGNQNSNVEIKEIERLEKSIDAINKMTDLLRERRAVLMKTPVT